MTNITRKKLNTEDYKLAYKEFVTLLSKLDRSRSGYFVNELFTDAEQVMLIKRFAAILMYKHGYGPYRVSQTFAVSISTAQRLFEQYNDGKYNNILGGIRPKERNKFISLIEDLIMAQVSPRARARLYNRVP